MKIGISGHREFDKNNVDLVKLLKVLFVNKVETIIVGGAPGFDTYMAYLAMEIHVPYYVYEPYTGFVKDNKVRKNARLWYTHTDRYRGNSCFFERNKLINDHSDLLITYYDGRKKGGTYMTIMDAKKKHNNLVNIYETT